jgi:hypothetical protein
MMTQTLRSIHILTSLEAQFREEFPGVSPPEEITVNRILVDDERKYFCSSGSDLTPEQVPSDTQTFIIDTFDNACEWKHLEAITKSEAKHSITTLYLGHDGCIEGELSDIEAVISGLPSLKEVHYCGYYAQYVEELTEVCDKRGVKCIPIY